MPITVCVLHDPEDALLAHRIAKDLRDLGVSARADIDVMKRGGLSESPAPDGALTASILLVVLTARSVHASLLVSRAMAEVWEDPSCNRRIIVGCSGTDRLPARLANATVIDFTDYDEGLETFAGLL